MHHIGKVDGENNLSNRLTTLLGIKFPIIQGGMIWASGWELASAVSNHGGLGTLGAGSMYPDILKAQIKKCKEATQKPFAVNLPLLYPDIESHIETIIQEKIPIVITSAGNPAKYTHLFKAEGIIVGHVVSNDKFAKKAETQGVDFIVAEGFEAGGHNGREEITTLNLISLLRGQLKVPLVAAGGIWDAKSMLAVMILGAEGVQMGSRFVCSQESSCHIDFKSMVIDSKAGHTSLELKKLTPVRLLHNDFYEEVKRMEEECADEESLKAFLGKGRAKLGMFEGDLSNGELEIGQNAMLLDDILSVEEIMGSIKKGFLNELRHMVDIL